MRPFKFVENLYGSWN